MLAVVDCYLGGLLQKFTYTIHKVGISTDNIIQPGFRG
ncbi:hypothetical protein L915_01964 [Phytophthora nicotianae]|nr:hypothetical protein L915_01964 [Phytophthora nicotianae]